MIQSAARNNPGRARSSLRFVQGTVIQYSLKSSYVFRSVSFRGVHYRRNQRFHIGGNQLDLGPRRIRRSVGSWLCHFSAPALHSTPQGLIKKIKKAVASLAVMAAVLLPLSDAQAGVIAGASGSTTESDSGSLFFFHLGSGLEGNLDSVYITINDRSQTGYLTDFNLFRCDSATYLSPATQCQSGTTNGTGNLWHAVTSVGGTTNQSVALSGAATKRTIRLDFGIHTLPGCNPGVSCTGSAADIELDPTKFYVVSFRGNANVDGAGAARSPSVYGITTLLTDADGNPIFCGTVFANQNYCSATMRTPYHILTDAALTPAEAAAFGFSASTQFQPWYGPAYFGIPASGSDYGLTSSGSLTGQDLGYFGNMMRDVMLFLFSPWDESTANSWTNFRNSLTVHVPFSYVTQTADILSDISVASGSIPSWTYSNASLSIASVSFFSSSTLTSYAPPGFLSALRVIIQTALWLAFLTHVWNSRHRLFS